MVVIKNYQYLLMSSIFLDRRGDPRRRRHHLEVVEEGGGVCNSPLVEAHIGTATGVLICVDPSLLTNPNNGGQCGSAIDVFIDSTHKCLPRSD